MTNSTTHTISAFLKPNGFIVFVATNFSDKAEITSDLQAQYGGGSLLRSFTFAAPMAMTWVIVRMVTDAIVLAEYPPLNAQLELIDRALSREAIAA